MLPTLLLDLWPAYHKGRREDLKRYGVSVTICSVTICSVMMVLVGVCIISIVVTQTTKREWNCLNVQLMATPRRVGVGFNAEWR